MGSVPANTSNPSVQASLSESGFVESVPALASSSLFNPSSSISELLLALEDVGASPDIVEELEVSDVVPPDELEEELLDELDEELLLEEDDEDDDDEEDDEPEEDDPEDEPEEEELEDEEPLLELLDELAAASIRNFGSKIITSSHPFSSAPRNAMSTKSSWPPIIRRDLDFSWDRFKGFSLPDCIVFDADSVGILSPACLYSSCQKSWRETFLKSLGLTDFLVVATAILCFVRPLGRTAKLVDEKVIFTPQLLATGIADFL